MCIGLAQNVSELFEFYSQLGCALSRHAEFSSKVSDAGRARDQMLKHEAVSRTEITEALSCNALHHLGVTGGVQRREEQDKILVWRDLDD